MAGDPVLLSMWGEREEGRGSLAARARPQESRSCGCSLAALAVQGYARPREALMQEPRASPWRTRAGRPLPSEGLSLLHSQGARALVESRWVRSEMGEK